MGERVQLKVHNVYHAMHKYSTFCGYSTQIERENVFQVHVK
jgi:hypothetical protein